MEPTQTLISWYKQNARILPWRSDTVDPYIVLVSETMLQQTQASRVAERLPEFLGMYPSVHELASASNGDIIRAWQGMGYNSRALRLRDAARAIVERHNGVIPDSLDELRSLPGVGPYTASAIACFAYNQYVVVLDVNVRRVYSRLRAPQATTIDIDPDKILQEYAHQVIPADDPATWHHAVMDLGATICSARAPKCDACPLASLCASAFTIQPANKPRKQEPMFRGEPQRLWRGRVVELLRKTEQLEWIDAEEIEDRLLGPCTHEERTWLSTLIGVLERDGLVIRRGPEVRLAD